MHPYRTVSDANGVAVMRVAAGAYSIMVSGSRYLPVKTEMTVKDNITTRAGLMKDPPRLSRDELY